MDQNRRSFLSSSAQMLGGAWVALHWPAISAAAAHAQAAVAAGAGALANLTAAQARDLDAISARIIPTDDTPGAHEAGVVYFIDQAIGGFFVRHRAEFLADYAAFAADVAKQARGRAFADLPTDQQTELLKGAQDARFFATTRLLTVVGFLASQRYGGNRDGIGWQVIGFKDEHVFQPPFGYYDRDYPGFVPYDAKGKA
jgi:gluconate 2-dehydrogenase gamma chain